MAFTGFQIKWPSCEIIHIIQRINILSHYSFIGHFFQFVNDFSVLLLCINDIKILGMDNFFQIIIPLKIFKKFHFWLRMYVVVF